MNVSIEEAKNALTSSRRVLIAGHSDPDGDALGSMLGLYHFLKASGIEAWLYRDGQLPVDYSFLPGSEFVTKTLPEKGWPDLLVLLDCHDVNRAGRELDEWYYEELPVLTLDHHLGDANPKYMVLKDPGYSATAELLTILLRTTGLSINIDTAQCLYAGVMADSGNFTQGNTTARLLDAASWLVSQGARPDELSLEAHGVTFNRLRMHGMALMGAKRFADGKILVVRITRKDLEEYNCTLADVEGLVEPLRFVKDSLIVALLKQVSEDKVKVSMRSKRHVDISGLAMRLGGGGHKNAAGFMVDGGTDEAEACFLKEAEALLESICEGQPR